MEKDSCKKSPLKNSQFESKKEKNAKKTQGDRWKAP